MLLLSIICFSYMFLGEIITKSNFIICLVLVTEIRIRKQKNVIDTDTDSDTPEILSELPEKPKATVRGRTRKTDTENDKEQVCKFLNTKH